MDGWASDPNQGLWEVGATVGVNVHGAQLVEKKFGFRYRSWVGERVGRGVGRGVGRPVVGRPVVGVPVGAPVEGGRLLGARVGSLVGATVGFLVGLSVGDLVGLVVGICVGERVVGLAVG